MKKLMTLGVVCGLAVCAHGAEVSGPDANGFTWATVRAPGNVGLPHGPYGIHQGRGVVNYDYRIATTEMYTDQWLEFANTFSMQSDELDELVRPFGWGARSDLNYSGPGNRYIYDYEFFYPPEGPGRKFVGVSWRQAAMYCNWLHNGKTSDPASLMSGAYDTSTFTQNPDGTFNDQSTRSPGATYWIPSLDEYLKAAFYDPNRYGEGEEGWWEYANSRDRLPIGGVPGVGETNAGFTHEDFLKYGFTAGTMPVGSYSEHQSPWGLLDISGSAPAWTEEWDFDILDRQLRRQYKPSQAGGVIDEVYESNWFFVGARPWQGSGFRIASSVPSPSTIITIAPFAIVAFKRRRRGPI